jgi:hypothetical protein
LDTSKVFRHVGFFRLPCVQLTGGRKMASMFDMVTMLFDASGFPARGQYGLWSATHGWVHILSDLGIRSASLIIPCVRTGVAIP